MSTRFSPASLLASYGEELALLGSRSREALSEAARRLRDSLAPVLSAGGERIDVERAAAIIDSLPAGELAARLREAAATLYRVLSRLVPRGLLLGAAVPGSPRAWWELTRLLHLAYLASGSESALDAAVITYTYYKALSLEGDEAVRAAAYALASAILVAAGRRLEGYALAATGLRRVLPAAPPPGAEGLEARAAALEASYLLEAAAEVDGGLLEAWGFYEALEAARAG